MGGQLLLGLLLTALRQLLQAPLEVGIPAGIALHTEPGGLLHQQLGLPRTHMEDAVAAVVGLLLVLVREQDGIDHLGGIGAEAGGPAAVVIAVLFVHIPVEPMLLGHMLRFGDVLGKGGIGPSVGAKQLVIAVTDSDLSHRRFQESRLSIHGAGNGIVILVKEQMVIVRNLPEVTVLTGREMSIGQGAYLRSVIGLECLTPGEALALDLSVIQVIHDLPDVPVQLLQRVIDPLFQLLQQVGFQPLNTLFHGGLPLGLSGGRRQDHHVIELLQVLIRRIQNQLVLRVLRHGCTEIVRHQILGNCAVVVQRMDGTGDETGQLLVGERLGVDHAADTDSGDKDMDFKHFAGLGVHQKLRLVADPVDVHPLAGNPFHRHTEALGAVVGGDILVEVVAELGVLVAAGMLLLVPQPHEVEIRLAALPVDAVVDGPEVGHDVLGLPADIGGRVEGGLHLRARHLFQDFQRDALGPVAGHDAVDGAVADTVPAAAIIVGDAPQAHLDDAKNDRAVLH